MSYGADKLGADTLTPTHTLTQTDAGNINTWPKLASGKNNLNQHSNEMKQILR